MKQPERGRPRRLGTEADAAEQLKLIADGLWNDRCDLSTILGSWSAGSSAAACVSTLPTLGGLLREASDARAVRHIGMLEHLGRALDQSMTVLVERGEIGAISGIAGAGLLLRLNHNEFPDLEGWESDAYKVVSLVAIAVGLAITASVGIRSISH